MITLYPICYHAGVGMNVTASAVRMKQVSVPAKQSDLDTGEYLVTQFYECDVCHNKISLKVNFER